VYLYAYLSARAIVSAGRVLLSPHRGRSLAVALASVIAGPSPWRTQTASPESSSGISHPDDVPPNVEVIA